CRTSYLSGANMAPCVVAHCRHFWCVSSSTLQLARTYKEGASSSIQRQYALIHLYAIFQSQREREFAIHQWCFVNMEHFLLTSSTMNRTNNNPSNTTTSAFSLRTQDP